MHTVYASSAEKLANFPPSMKLFPAVPSATVILRPSKMKVNTSPYYNTSQWCSLCWCGATLTFLRQDSKNATGSFPYLGADPMKGMKWKTSGGNDGSLGKT